MDFIRKFHRYFFIIIFLSIILIFFHPLFFKGLLPIPSDTIVGLYHPFRDFYAKDYPNGIPFKNFLITDPVRQQYPWRELAIDLEKKLQPPLWNPYSFAGAPLLGNFQAAPFYPLNILFLFLPFKIGWSILIVLQPFLAGLFLYLYLTHMKIRKEASLLGALVFSFSGFNIAWLEWNTVVHTAIWLPLILLSVDKISLYFRSIKISNIKYQISKIYIKNQKLFFWSVVFIFSLVSSFFAGHLQTFFYLSIVIFFYFLARWIQYGKQIKALFLFLIFAILFLILTSIQWVPTLQFIFLSARSIDQMEWAKPGWFIPWEHLIQFVAPDFFGNPTTLNYWGVWNYAEFIGYVGILPLIFALFALFFRRDKKTLFFGTVFFVSLIFALKTPFAKLPYMFQIPFISTAQPTRLLFLTDFSLAILCSLGFDHFMRERKGMFHLIGFIGLLLIGLWIFVLIGNGIGVLSEEHLLVAKHNLIFPTFIFVISAVLLLVSKILSRSYKFTIMIYIIIVVVLAFDLLRFGNKFVSFTKQEYLFPNTKTLDFLKHQSGLFRIASTDSRIFPPNFATYYRIQSIEGYDPLYLASYAELIAASERGKPDISPPFGFNRIITPHNYESKIIDLLGVKYILSLSDMSSPRFKKVFQEGQTRVYENRNVMPRAFFVNEVKWVEHRQSAIKIMFQDNFDFRQSAVVENSRGVQASTPLRCTRCSAKIVYYGENKIKVHTENDSDGFLVLTDSFYPTWHVAIDNTPSTIYKTGYNFRGVIVPKGAHTLEFYTSIW